MTLSELLKRRIILLSGKGGVGKTFISLALALTQEKRNKKTLIVEMNSTERVAPYFGLKKIGPQVKEIRPNLHAINLNPQECFQEYVLQRVKFKKIIDTFINNRFITYFLSAIPGFNELLMIGKIYELEKEKTKNGLVYDSIIVDGPASGHGVSAFEVPLVVNRLVKVGPLKTQSEKIIELLKDAKKTAFSVVTLAEEMPVTETLELKKGIETRLEFALGPLFVNKIKQTDLNDADKEKILKQKLSPEDELYPYWAYTKFSMDREKLNQKYVKLLQKQEMNLVEISEWNHEPAKEADLADLVSEWAKIES